MSAFSHRKRPEVKRGEGSTTPEHLARSRLVDVGADQYVLADRLGVDAREPKRMSQLAEQLGAGAGAMGRHEHEQLVRQIGFDEGGGERRPSFEQKRLHALASQRRK